MVKNVAPTQTWKALQADGKAKLVDVRTDMEWNSVGVPDLASADKETVLIQWQIAPTMQRNAGFEDDLKRAGLTPDDAIYFICRSGVRSMAAAEAALAAGFGHVFNVTDGFEGPADFLGRRGGVAGWKADGLPWRKP